MKAKPVPEERIVVFAPHFGEYAFNFANALSIHHSVLFIVNDVPDGESWRRELHKRHFRLKIKTLEVSLRRIICLPSVLSTIVALIAWKPTVVVYQEVPEKWTALFMLITRRIASNVLTVHDPIPHSGGDARLPSWLELLRRISRRLAHHALVHGEFCARQFRDAEPYWRGKVLSMHHGVVMVPSVIRSSNAGTLLFFGRMQSYKGLSVLLAAITVLEERGEFYEFVIAGRGPELTRLKPDLLKKRSVVVKDFYISSKEAESLYQEAEVILMPYLDASQSGVAAAAFANRRPVIASNVGGIPDVVLDGFNGLLVPPGSASHLADAISKFMSHAPLRESLTTGAFATADGILNWNTIASDISPQFSALHAPLANI